MPSFPQTDIVKMRENHFSWEKLLRLYFPLSFWSLLSSTRNVQFSTSHHVKNQNTSHVMDWYVRYSHEIQSSPSRLMNWSHDVVLALLEHYIQNILDTAVSDYTSVFLMNIFHKIFNELHRSFQFFRNKSVQGIFGFINWIEGCQNISREKILRKKELVSGRRKTLLFLLKRRKKLYFWSFCCLWYFCNKWRWLAGGVLHKYWFLWYFLTWSFVVSCDIFSQTINTR